MSICKTLSLGYQLKQTQHMLRIRMDEALRPLNLTTPQYAVLSQLQSQPGISNAALARASFVTAQTMHGIVTNLEKNTLVKRKCDPDHGRILCADLTAQGIKALKQAQVIVSQVEAVMTHSMSKKNLTLLEELLLECVKNLNRV